MDNSSDPSSRHYRELWIQGARVTKAANAFAPNEFFSSQTTSTYHEESYEEQGDTRTIFQPKKKHRPPPQPRPTTADQAHHYNPAQHNGQNANYYNSHPASPPGQPNAQYHGHGGQVAQTSQAGYLPSSSPVQMPYSPPPPITAAYNMYQQAYGDHQGSALPHTGSQFPVTSSPPLGSPNSQHSPPLNQSNAQQQSYSGYSHQDPFSSTTSPPPGRERQRRCAHGYTIFYDRTDGTTTRSECDTCR